MGPYRARAKEKRGTLKESETETETQSKNETDNLTSQPSPSAALLRGTGVRQWGVVSGNEGKDWSWEGV